MKIPKSVSADLKPAAPDEATEVMAEKYLAGLEKTGRRFGIVAFNDADLIETLENAGAEPTPGNICAVREHKYVRRIKEQVVEAGCQAIEAAIRDLELASRIHTNEEGKQ